MLRRIWLVWFAVIALSAIGHAEGGEEQAARQLPKQHEQSPLWKTEFPGRAVDHVCHRASGDVLLAGRVLRCVGSAGQILWELDKPPLTVTCPPVFDGSQNALLAGRETGALVVAKVDSKGNIVWQTRIDGLLGDYGTAESVVLSKEGQVLVMGVYKGESATDMRVFLAAFDPQGRHVKLVRGDKALSGGTFGVTGYSLTIVRTLALAADGSSFISLSRFYEKPELIVARFDAEGRQQWTAACDEFDDLHVTAMFVGETGDLYIAGANKNERGVVASIDSRGKTQWTRTLECGTIRAAALASGRLYVASNRFPNRNAAVIQEVSLQDGSIAATRDIAYDQGLKGTGFVHALSVGPDGRTNLVINWEQVVTSERGAGFVSPACISFGLK